MIEQIRFPILKGMLRGCRWAPSSGGKLLRILFGTYEREQSLAFRDTLRPGNVVYDLGANVGYYSCLCAKLVGPEGRVIAFEPDPVNAGYLRQHVRWNRLTNVVVQESAVGAKSGETHFRAGTGTGTGHVSDDGGTPIRIRRLDDFVEESGLIPHHLKIDVEGHECAVLEGALRTIERHRPTIFLSTHGPDVHAHCLSVLGKLKYRLTPLTGRDLETCTEIVAAPSA